MDLDPIREVARQTETEKLHYWVKNFSVELAPKSLAIFEDELRGRGFADEEIASLPRDSSKALRSKDGRLRVCSFCRRPALVRGWGWQRLMGRLPLCPRRFSYCDRHSVESDAPLFLHRLKKTAKWAAISIGVSINISIVSWWGHREYYAYKADQELSTLVAELDASDPGWRLEEMEAARAAIPEKENSARIVVEAKQLMPSDWPTPFQAAKPDNAGQFFLRNPIPAPPTLEQRLHVVSPEEPLDKKLADELSHELERIPAALKKARQLANMPRGRHVIDYKPDLLSTLLRDQAASREITKLLCFDAMMLAENGETDRALTSCRAAINSGRSIGDEPLLISLMIRIACIATSIKSLERAMAQGRASEPELRQIQELLADEDRQELFLNTVRGDRAGVHHMYQHFEAEGVPETNLFIVGPGHLKKNHYWQMKWLTELIEISRAVENRDESLGVCEARQRKEHELFPQDTLMAGKLMAAVKKPSITEHRHHAIVRCTIAAIASERFYLRRQRWPESLRELVDEGLLPAIPRNPFDGQPLELIVTDKGIMFAAIDLDGKETSGDKRQQKLAEPSSIGRFQLWDPKSRRQKD